MHEARQWFDSLQQQQRLLGLGLLLVMTIYLGMAAALAGFWLMAVFEAVAVILVASALFMPAAGRDSWRHLMALVAGGSAIVVNLLWQSAAAQWLSVLGVVAFLLLTPQRALLFTGIAIAGVFALLAWGQGWRQALSWLLIPACVAGVVYILARALHEASQRWDDSLASDTVTGCGNAQRLRNEMQGQAELCRRYKLVATAMVLEIENWQAAESALGERRASDWLRELVAVWSSRMRNTDILCRFRDARFVMLLPNTSAQQAQHLIEDLQKASAAYRFKSEQAPSLRCRAEEFDAQQGVDDWIARLAADAHA